MKVVIALLAVVLPLVATACTPNAQSQSPKPDVSVPASAAPTVQKAEGLWIDVRTADEFAGGHLGGAINLTHTDIVSQIAQVAPDKNQAIHLYCQSGRRAETALSTLKQLGYTNVTNHGGYQDLKSQGLK